MATWDLLRANIWQLGVVGPVFALFTVGYILGVWMACLVFRQPQRPYEDGVPAMEGEDFLARMRAGGGTRLPVVVLTVKNLAPGEISALETAGAMAVLPKEADAPQAAVALIAEALALAPVAG